MVLWPNFRFLCASPLLDLNLCFQQRILLSQFNKNPPTLDASWHLILSSSSSITLDVYTLILTLVKNFVKPVYQESLYPWCLLLLIFHPLSPSFYSLTINPHLFLYLELSLVFLPSCNRIDPYYNILSLPYHFKTVRTIFLFHNHIKKNKILWYIVLKMYRIYILKICIFNVIPRNDLLPF